MNKTTLIVASLFACTELNARDDILHSIWRQNSLGCRILLVLQDMYKFHVKYDTKGTNQNFTLIKRLKLIYPKHNSSTDVYVKPMAITPEALSVACPIEAIFIWRSGFTLRRADYGIFRTFYTEPFSPFVWDCIGLLILFTTLMLYVLKCWEKVLFGNVQNCSFIYELLVALAACCQHYMPGSSQLISRRTTYFFLFLFTFVMYNFYTANLLSHLVSDRNNKLSLIELAESTYKCVVLDDMKLGIEGKVSTLAKYLIDKKFPNSIESVNLNTGLNAVESGTTALYAEYSVIYTPIKAKFDEDTMCQLIEVDLYKNIKKYLFTSKSFVYREEFKIGILRAMETGILKRLKSIDSIPQPYCVKKSVVLTQLEHIFTPLSILGLAYVLAFFILLVENIEFYRHNNLPYIE